MKTKQHWIYDDKGEIMRTPYNWAQMSPWKYMKEEWKRGRLRVQIEEMVSVIEKFVAYLAAFVSLLLVIILFPVSIPIIWYITARREILKARVELLKKSQRHKLPPCLKYHPLAIPSSFKPKEVIGPVDNVRIVLPSSMVKDGKSLIGVGDAIAVCKPKRRVYYVVFRRDATSAWPACIDMRPYSLSPEEPLPIITEQDTLEWRQSPEYEEGS